MTLGEPVKRRGPGYVYTRVRDVMRRLYTVNSDQGGPPDGVTAAGTLPNRTLYAGTVAVAVAVPVGEAFRNASTYQASSSTPGVATVRVSGSTVTVTSVAEGVATITVTASGADGSTATQRFTVTVLASTASRPSQFLELRRRIEALRRGQGR